MNVDQCPYTGKVKEPLGFRGRQVYAAVAHGMTKIVVPIGSVQPIPFVKIHGVGHVCQIVADAGHIGRNVFYIDAILPRDCWRGG